jgi:hypothetical protein
MQLFTLTYDPLAGMSAEKWADGNFYIRRGALVDRYKALDGTKTYRACHQLLCATAKRLGLQPLVVNYGASGPRYHSIEDAARILNELLRKEVNNNGDASTTA